MNEKLLHFIWKYALFDRSNLQTTGGENIEIVNKGTYNTDSGADFQNAKIRIGNTLWAGNVEIHIQSDDWFAHKHETDTAYDNVILHVVYQKKGKPATHKSGEPIATLELKNRIRPEMLSRYDQLSQRKDWIPCAAFIQTANATVVNNFLERLLIERLENKVAEINKLLAESENDWENVMFLSIARYFGAGINKEQFFQLAKTLPVKIWAKHQYDKLQIEALLFGQAGFLDDNLNDDYPKQLRKEYNYLKRLHQLQPMPKHVWKFLRLRPSNFPTVRLAQLAGLMCKEVKFFSKLLELKSIKSVHQFFDSNVSPYWETHYQFDKPNTKASTHIGSSMKDVLLINAVAPVLFAYGKYKGDEACCARAFQLLETCHAESNSIITGWANMNIKPTSAAQTQSLIQLKTQYCDKFRCLDCAIGHNILKSSVSS